MTEKRFIYYYEGDLLISIKDTSNNKELNLIELVEVANDVVKENEQLKKEIKYLQSELHNATYDVRKMTLKEVKDEIEKLERWE